MAYTDEDLREAERAVGMTVGEVADLAAELSQQTDRNHPTESGSWHDFAKTMREGHKELMQLDYYNKRKQ
jgi:hypothetical protein